MTGREPTRTGARANESVNSTGSSTVCPLPDRALFDVGWGFIVAWGISIIFTDIFSADSSANLGVFWLTSMIGAPFGLLVCFFFGERLRLDDPTSPLPLLSTVVILLGTIVMAIAPPTDSPLAAGVQACAGFTSSLGTAAYTVLWGIHYGGLDMQRIERSAIYSLIVSFLCYACALALPKIASKVFIACLPVASFAFLRLGARGASKPDGDGPSEPPADINIKRFIKLGLGIVATTTVISLCWSLVSEDIVHLSTPLFSISMLSGMIVAVLLIAYLTNFSRSLNLGTLYRWILPLVTVSFAVLIAFGEDLALLSYLLIFAAQALLNLLTFVYFAELTQRTHASPYKVFGLGRFFNEVGFLLGMLCMPLARSYVESFGSYNGVLAIALAAFTVLVMISISVQGQLAFTLDECDVAVTPSSSDGPASPDAFSAACRQVAEAHGLTHREQEVLFYLAQGYSLPYIRNELFIAQSTIDTHVRHIYKKLDIHSKEELITLVRKAM